MRNTYTNLHPVIKLMIVFTLVFIGLFFSQIFSGIILLLSTPADIINTTYCPESINVNVLKAIQGISAIFTFLIPAYAVAFISHPDPSHHLRINKRIDYRETIMVILLMISCIPVINLMAEWNAALNLPDALDRLEKIMITMEESAQHMQEQLLAADNSIGLVVNLIVIAVLPALGEEILFRGIIQRTLREWLKNPHAAIIVTGFLFSFVHFQFFGFIPRMFLGIIFGYLLYWTGKLWIPILAHFVNNALATMWYYIYFKNEKAVPNPDEFGTSSESVFLYISIVIFIAIVYIYFYRQKRIQHALKK
ncbi:MAG: CPBP family intramembrane metalloprotease [Candidatus Delongbacteria bacterium]|nr:CPBP family intramembrane metalloprotease [Candidatus Delongbacteria bacterium]